MTTVTFNGVRVTDSNASTGWGNNGGGGPSPAAEPQLAYQKPNAVNRKVTTTASLTGVEYNGGSNNMVASHPLFIFKGKVADAGDLNTTYGLQAIFGSAAGAAYQYNLSGSGANNDQFVGGYNSQGGLAEGYVIAAINPSIAQWREGTVGSPTLTAVAYYAIGAQFVVGGAKSENVGMDAIDLATGLDYSGTLFDFLDAVLLDQDIDTNRWGLACRNGSVISLRGLQRLGTAAMSGADVSTVIFPDGYHGTGDCGFELNTGAARTYGLAGSYRGLGRIYGADDTRPNITVIGDASGSVPITGALENFNSITLNAGTPVTGAILGFTTLVPGAAAISGSQLKTNAAVNVAAIVDPDFTKLSQNLFSQVGLGHAIEITSPGTYISVGNDFGGYGATGSGDAVIYNNSGGLVTILVTSGGQSPTYRNGAGASTVVSNPATVTFTGIPNGLEGRVRKGAFSIFFEASITGNQFVHSYTYGVDEEVTITIGGVADDSISYERQIFKITLTGGDARIPLSFSPNPSYI